MGKHRKEDESFSGNLFDPKTERNMPPIPNPDPLETPDLGTGIGDSSRSPDSH